MSISSRFVESTLRPVPRLWRAESRGPASAPSICLVKYFPPGLFVRHGLAFHDVIPTNEKVIVCAIRHGALVYLMTMIRLRNESKHRSPLAEREAGRVGGGRDGISSS